jgi:four helix bundle protein
MNQTIKHFTQLKAWQTSHQLILNVYQLTRQFPKQELYCLTNQMRRAAISITSNIAEGFGRKTFSEKSQFYTVSRGSLTELENQFIIAKDLNYLSPENYDSATYLISQSHKLLSGLIRNTKKLNQSQKEF